MKTFKVGQKLSARSIGDYDCIFKGEVLKRTEKTLTINTDQDGIKRVKIFTHDNQEYVFPFGKYSMAPVFKAA